MGVEEKLPTGVLLTTVEDFSPAEAAEIMGIAEDDVTNLVQEAVDEIERLKGSRENFRTEYLALIQKFSDAASANFPLITSAPSGSEAVAAAPSAAATQLQAAVNPYGTQVQAAIDDLD